MRAVILSIVALTLLVGCPPTLRYAPQPAESVTLFNEDRVSARTERVGVTLAYDAMDWAPSALRGRVIGFRVAVRNYGDEPLPLEPHHFLLYDGEGNQYSPVSPGELAQFAQAVGPRVAPRVGLGFGTGYGYWDRHYGGWGTWGLGPTGWYDTYGYAPRFLRTVFARSLFPMAPLSPDARASGLIYFRGEFDAPQELILELRVPGEPVRRFPFARE